MEQMFIHILQAKLDDQVDKCDRWLTRSSLTCKVPQCLIGCEYIPMLRRFMCRILGNLWSLLPQPSHMWISIYVCMGSLRHCVVASCTLREWHR